MYKYQKGWDNNMKRSVRKRADKKLSTTEVKLLILAHICLNFSFALLYQASYYLCHIHPNVCAFGVCVGWRAHI